MGSWLICRPWNEALAKSGGLPLRAAGCSWQIPSVGGMAWSRVPPGPLFLEAGVVCGLADAPRRQAGCGAAAGGAPGLASFLARLPVP